jgi:putative phosphoesterase
MRATRSTHTRQTLELRDGGLRLVVVADTHGRPHPRSAEHIAAQKPAAIVHAGDIGELGVLDELAKIAPVHAIRGNIDSHARETPDTITLEIADGGRSRLRILVMHIGVYGPKLRGDAAGLARRERASLVICGHSHVPFIGRDKGLSIFNPGSIGPRRFHLPIVFGVLDIDRERLEMRHIDCETGKIWQP